MEIDENIYKKFEVYYLYLFLFKTFLNNFQLFKERKQYLNFKYL